MDKKLYKNWHLAKTELEFNLTEFEWTIIRFNEAFSRYVLAAGMVTIIGDVEIKYPEHVILHVIRMFDRPKNSATIARLINRDDIPNIQYSLRKLEAAGLIEKSKDKNSKNFSYTTTEKGVDLTNEYYRLRQEILMTRLEEITGISEKIEKTGRILSLLTGIYEEAARDSAAFAPKNDS